MAATVVLYEYTGTTAGTTTSSNKFSGTIVHRAADMASETTPGSNPIIKPAAGNAYSYERHTRMQVTGGTYTSLTNPKFFTANTSWGTGVTPYAKTTTASTGATPALPTDGTLANYTATSTLVTGARKSLGTYTLTNNATGALGDYLITMVQVASTASAGTAGNETWTWAYDEA